LNNLPPDPRARRARIIRNAVILALAAIAIYAMFIMTMAQRSQGAS
jgi:hypothetical protein